MNNYKRNSREYKDSFVDLNGLEMIEIESIIARKIGEKRNLKTLCNTKSNLILLFFTFYLFNLF